MKTGFKEWTPYRPVIHTSTTEFDPVTGEGVRTLRYKRPRCLKAMPLPEMRQDWGVHFSHWYFDEMTGEAVIVLKVDEEQQEIRVLDPMWLVNLSEADIKVLYENRIQMQNEYITQCLQYQRVIDVCYLNGIHNGAIWDSRWFKLQEKIEAESADWKAKIEERRKIASRSRFMYAPFKAYVPPKEPAPIVKSRPKFVKRGADL